MKDESIENTIITLHGKGLSIRRISVELLISRKRIRRVLVSNSVLRESCPVPITDDHLVVYSPAREQLVTHTLAEPDCTQRYVGIREKTGKKPDLVIADIIPHIEAFSPEMSKYIDHAKRYKPGS